MPKTKILFITSEEHGQVNVHLTVSSTLVKRFPDQLDAHLCSFKKVAARCPDGVTYHTLRGVSQADGLRREFGYMKPGLRTNKWVPWSHPPHLLAQLRATMMFKDALFPWSDAEYLEITQQVENVITFVQPDLVVLDPICGFGSDAVFRLGQRAITLSPVAWNACARGTADKENKDWILHWPSICSGNPFPMPWYLYPANLVHFIFTVLWLLFLSPGFRRLNKARVAAGYHTTTPLCRSPFPIVCPGTMALDMSGNPSPRVVPVGPIMQEYPPIASLDVDLAAWLDRGGKGKTIVFALGSHILLDTREALEVLWKLKPCPENESAKGDIDAARKQLDGRLRVEEWFDVDPPAMLATGNVGLFMHHGGGNSYHEALGNGVPQLVIASWADCYDYAQRVRELGIGEWGNECDAPTVSEHAVRDAIFKVIGRTPSDPIALQYAANAAKAVPISRDADSMPLVPRSGAEWEKAGEQELDVVKQARAAHGDAEGSSENVGAKVEVHGRDVAAEWIFRWALGDTPTIW